MNPQTHVHRQGGLICKREHLFVPAEALLSEERLLHHPSQAAAPAWGVQPQPPPRSSPQLHGARHGKKSYLTKSLLHYFCRVGSGTCREATDTKPPTGSIPPEPPLLALLMFAEGQGLLRGLQATRGSPQKHHAHRQQQSKLPTDCHRIQRSHLKCSPAATSGMRKPWFSKECKFIGDFEHKHPGLIASKNLPMCTYSSTAGLCPRLPDQMHF